MFHANDISELSWPTMNIALPPDLHLEIRKIRNIEVRRRCLVVPYRSVHHIGSLEFTILNVQVHQRIAQAGRKICSVTCFTRDPLSAYCGFEVGIGRFGRRPEFLVPEEATALLDTPHETSPAMKPE